MAVSQGRALYAFLNVDCPEDFQAKHRSPYQPVGKLNK